MARVNIRPKPGDPDPLPRPQFGGKMSQNQYLDILFNDCGFTRTQRNAWLSYELKRPVKDLDMLSVAEKSQVIDTLKELKEIGMERTRRRETAWDRYDPRDNYRK